jgi:hypothetical protein
MLETVRDVPALHTDACAFGKEPGAERGEAG